MSKNIFVVLLCSLLVGSVAAEQQSNQIVPVTLEQENDWALEVSVQKDKVRLDGCVEITDDGRYCADIKAKGVFPQYESAEFKVCDEKTVEVIFVSGPHGYVNIKISTEKPEFIAALKAVAQEDQEKLVNVVVEHLRAFVRDETEECTDAFYAQYEDKIAQDIQEILSAIVYNLEGAQALVKLYQDLATHICPIVDQEIAAVKPEMSVTQASWEVGMNVNNAVVKFLRNTSLDAEKVTDHPLRRTPMEIRFAVMNAVNQEYQDFVMSNAQIQELELAGQVLKQYFQKLPILVFTTLKGFYPALDEAILNQ